MARFSGRNAGLWSVGLIGLVTVGPLAVFSLPAASLGLAAAGCLFAGTALARIAALKSRCETLSKDVDVLSQRLLKAESALSQRPAAGPPHDSLRQDVSELTVEIGLLSGIVRDLSAVLQSQDEEIARLKGRERMPVPAPLPSPFAPPSAPPPAPAAEAALPVPPPPPKPIEQVWTPPVLDTLPPTLAPEPALARRPIPPRPPETARAPDDAAILAAFERDQLEVFLQPVVTLPQRKVVGYEALARLKIEQETLPAEQFCLALERNGRTTELDRRMLSRTSTIVRHLARRGSDARVTYGLSPLSLFELSFLKDIARMAGDEQGLAGLDIALPQASWRGLDGGQLGLLAALRGRVGFCLDRPVDLRFDAHELAQLGIGQVKVPANLLLRPPAARGAISDLAVEDLAPALARGRVRLVVSEVASEADVPDLIDLNVPFAQGAAFAPARPVRGEILASVPPEPPAPPPQDDPGPERRSFRSLLRRAS